MKAKEKLERALTRFLAMKAQGHRTATATEHEEDESLDEDETNEND